MSWILTYQETDSEFIAVLKLFMAICLAGLIVFGGLFLLIYFCPWYMIIATLFPVWLSGLGSDMP